MTCLHCQDEATIQEYWDRGTCEPLAVISLCRRRCGPVHQLAGGVPEGSLPGRMRWTLKCHRRGSKAWPGFDRKR
jgi:hypothetical protein